MTEPGNLDPATIDHETIQALIARGRAERSRAFHAMLSSLRGALLRNDADRRDMEIGPAVPRCG